MSTDIRYSIYQDGMDVTFEGGLASDLEVKEANGKKYISLSIAVNGGSKKKEDGTWEQVTDWNQVTIWEWNGGNARELISFVENNTNEKVKFYKGNRIKLKCTATKILSEGKDGKTYINWNIHKFYDLVKIMGNNSGNSKSESSGGTLNDLSKDNF